MAALRSSPTLPGARSRKCWPWRHASQIPMFACEEWRRRRSTTWGSSGWMQRRLSRALEAALGDSDQNVQGGAAMRSAESVRSGLRRSLGWHESWARAEYQWMAMGSRPPCRWA